MLNFDMYSVCNKSTTKPSTNLFFTEVIRETMCPGVYLFLFFVSQSPPIEQLAYFKAELLLLAITKGVLDLKPKP